MQGVDVGYDDLEALRARPLRCRPLAVATVEAVGTTHGLLVLAATLALVALVPAVLRRR